MKCACSRQCLYLRRGRPLGSDQYDPNGNTTLSGGVSDAYDFENHLVQKGGVAITYDGDGNRVSETVGGVTTNYLVDTAEPDRLCPSGGRVRTGR